MMEETANPTPSSTFAPEMPTTTREAKANTTSIKLLIKASNQQHEDQIIESDLLWTVLRLKTQLSLVYPSKPPVAEQKLIYSGQLLNDRAQLKDIIRSYKDVYTQNHILHLVYTPKNQPLQPQKSTKMTPTTDIVSDGLRQRHSVASSTSSSNNNNNNNLIPNTATQQTPQQQMPTPFGFLPPGLQQQQHSSVNASGIFTPNNTTTVTTNGNGFDMQTLAAQQVAMYNWMWQTYGQYMQQYAQNNAAQMPTTTSPAHTINPVIAFPNLPPAALFSPSYPSQQHEIPTTISTPIPTTTTTATAQQAEQPPLQQEPEVAAAAAAPAPPQPRFPNIVQEEQENRDWLDSFFSVMRFALFITVLYFNASPMRCFVVFIIAGGIYLYHIGFFRLRQERNNNDINRINNAAAEPEPVPPREVPARVEQQDQPDNNAVAGEETPATPQTETSSASSDGNTNAGDAASAAAQDVVAVDNNSTSVIAFMRSFIVSFFTSLLPETPAAL